MSSKTKRVGDIGENYIISNLLEFRNIVVSKPITDNESYDCVLDMGEKFYKAQIKTCEFITDERYMRFSVDVTNPFSKTRRKYTKDEVDIFLLYCIENKYCGLMLFSEYISSDTKIWLKPPLNRMNTGNKWHEDYELHKRISSYNDLGYFIENGRKSKRLEEVYLMTKG